METVREAAARPPGAIGVKFIEPIGAAAIGGRRGGRNKYYQFTAIDDCTRLRVLRIYPQLNRKTAIQFLDYVRHPMN